MIQVERFDETQSAEIYWLNQFLQQIFVKLVLIDISDWQEPLTYTYLRKKIKYVIWLRT